MDINNSAKLKIIDARLINISQQCYEMELNIVCLSAAKTEAEKDFFDRKIAEQAKVIESLKMSYEALKKERDALNKEKEKFEKE